MKIAEILLGIIVVVLTVLTYILNLEPYFLSGILVVFGIFYFFGTAPIFLSTGYPEIFGKKNKTKEEVIRLIFSGFSCFIISSAFTMVVFKIQNYPGSNSLITYVVILALLSCFSAYNVIKNNDIVYKRALLRFSLFIAFDLFLYYTPIGNIG